MFTSKHYVPILKWKAAEHEALAQLSQQHKSVITPLLQLVLPGPKSKKGQPRRSPEEQRAESLEGLMNRVPFVPQQISDFWGGTPAFLDLSLLPVDRTQKAGYFTRILSGACHLGLTLIPVVDLDAEECIYSAVVPFLSDIGLCLRLSRCHFSTDTTAMGRIEQRLSSLSLSPQNVDLLVDFKVINEIETDSSFYFAGGQAQSFDDIRRAIPSISQWRTFTFATGAFPVDLTGCKVGEKNLLPRADWAFWDKQMRSNGQLRKPTYSDYTIQHPIYNESALQFTPSASIKYTLEDKWLIMRGQQKKSEQYLANAQLLSQMNEFYGADFSYGDAYILNKGKDLKSKHTGNSKTWLAAGINHHLACTATQIANLS
jgi:hypothetical protein